MAVETGKDEKSENRKRGFLNDARASVVVAFMAASTAIGGFVYDGIIKANQGKCGSAIEWFIDDEKEKSMTVELLKKANRI